jgi:hypothetical protein
VTFRSGNVGRFDTGKIASGSATEVTKNYLRFTVERGESLASAGFFADSNALHSTLRYAVTVDDNYMLLDLGDVCNTPITRNTEYVLDYARLVDSVMYTVYYMDSFSGEQIASPTIAYGNEGDVITGIAPLAIAGYFTSDAATSLTLDKNAENTVTFYYSTNEAETITNTVIVNVPGDTVVVNETGQTVTTTTGNASAAVANGAVADAAAGAVADADGAAAEVVDNAADDADNAGNADAADTVVEIFDEDVPLGADDNVAVSSDDNIRSAGFIIAGVILIAAAVVVKTKRKN